MKSKMYSIKDDNKFLKDQAKGCMRQNNTLRIALQKNYENLERLKAMGPEELRMELLSGNHAKGLVLDPTKINNIGQPLNAEYTTEEVPNESENLQNPVPTESNPNGQNTQFPKVAIEDKK